MGLLLRLSTPSSRPPLNRSFVVSISLDRAKIRTKRRSEVPFDSYVVVVASRLEWETYLSVSALDEIFAMSERKRNENGTSGGNDSFFPSRKRRDDSRFLESAGKVSIKRKRQKCDVSTKLALRRILDRIW